MSSTRADRSALLAAVLREVRRMTAQSVLISQAVSERFGLSSSDLECLDLALLSGGATAGEFAKATGLTTGAITGVIDRLERDAIRSFQYQRYAEGYPWFALAALVGWFTMIVLETTWWRKVP